jgi:hypothetical protein
MSANREAWASNLISTVGRQQRVSCTVEENCITVHWVEKHYGRSMLTDYLAAAAAHEDCQKMRAASENPRREIIRADEWTLHFRFC